MSVEGTVKAARVGGSIFTQIKPSPTLAPVQYWQGIVEISAKGVVLVSIFILFIASSVAQDEANNINDNNANLNRAIAAAGWTIFLGIIGLIYGILYLVCRFVNFAFMTNYRTVVLVTDIIVNGVLAFLLLTGAASLAATADYLTDILNTATEFRGVITTTRNAIGAAAFFAFFSMFAYLFVVLWMALLFIKKWDVKGSGGSGGDTSAPV
uniref:MARVEL domain-containing protein n=1 Tax=Amphimedon queenslandica TaxID=400682 RepID=A0A1X7VQV5_AMPQE